MSPFDAAASWSLNSNACLYHQSSFNRAFESEDCILRDIQNIFLKDSLLMVDGSQVADLEGDDMEERCRR